MKNTLNNLMALFKFICGNLMECQRRVLKIRSIQIGKEAFWPEVHFNHKDCLILIKICKSIYTSKSS